MVLAAREWVHIYVMYPSHPFTYINTGQTAARPTEATSFERKCFFVALQSALWVYFNVSQTRY